MKVSDPIALVLKSKETAGLLSVTPEQTVYEAITVMAKHNIGSLLVMSGDKLVGIFSERDYARKCALLGHASKDTQVHEIMTSPVFFVGPNHTVDDCMTMMTDRHIRHLPVLENDGRVLGIVSIGDLVKWVIRGQEDHIKTLEGYVSGGYMS